MQLVSQLLRGVEVSGGDGSGGAQIHSAHHVHRPAVVCGDSIRETAKYDGVYYLIHYLRKWPSVLKLFNIGNREVSLNLVPVDFVVDSMAALVRDPRAIGKTIQLADPNPLTTHELFNTIARRLKGSGSRFTVPAPLVQFSLMLPPSPRITDLPHHGVPYFFLKQTYDTRQASLLLEPHDLRCPPFSSYADTIIDYAVSHRSCNHKQVTRPEHVRRYSVI